jgi:glutathione synthase/RimK-type ligase-like ATP-grasp enzyme
VSADLRVLVVAQPGDPHADVVEARLSADNVPVARTSLNAWARQTIRWSSTGELLLQTEDERSWSIGKGTTVWWRRPGWFENGALARDELDLARDESAVMLPGVLAAVGVRWVDEPWTAARARNRLVQFSHAIALHIPLPETVVTNSPIVAAAFLATGPVLAKAISSGPGLAPFVEEANIHDMGLVANAPVFLQRMIKAEADWRLVTVEAACYAWRSVRRPDGPVDWRAEDPAGLAFQSVSAPSHLRTAALKLQGRLGLTFSVQDWLEAGDTWTFLEVNPQGQWLFLDAADSLVGESLAMHLARRSK